MMEQRNDALKFNLKIYHIEKYGKLFFSCVYSTA